MDDIVWAGGERWRRVRGSGTILGLYFDALTSNVPEWQASVPMAGAWLLVQVQWQITGLSGYANMHGFQLAVGGEVATSTAEFDAMERVVPYAGGAVSGTRGLRSYSIYRPFRLPVGRGLVLNGKRFVGEMTGSGTTTHDGYVALVLEELAPVRDGDVGEISRPGILGELSAAAAAARGS